MSLSDKSLFAELMASEHRYFAMGADIIPVPGAEIAIMPDFAAEPAGAVIQKTQAAVLASEGPAWIDEVERRLSHHGVEHSRIYMTEDTRECAELLAAAGYRRRVELAFAGQVEGDPGRLGLRPVRNHRDWQNKIVAHGDASKGPDGHSNNAARYVALERAKSTHGLDCFLAIFDDEVVGAIGAIAGDHLLRGKNVVIRPAFQRRGLGKAMIRALFDYGCTMGLDTFGLFAVENSAGAALYHDVGLRVVGQEIEWSKRLDANP